MDTIENEDYASQLRSLRLILGKNFRPISTEVLASLTRIPTVSIRGVEAGRRTLNDEDRKNIELSLGARWDQESRSWICVWSNDKGPYTRHHYEIHSKGMEMINVVSARNLAAFSESLNHLLINLGLKGAAWVLLELHYELMRIAREHKMKKEVLEFIASRHFELLAQIPKEAEKTDATPSLKKSKAKH